MKKFIAACAFIFATATGADASDVSCSVGYLDATHKLRGEVYGWAANVCDPSQRPVVQLVIKDTSGVETIFLLEDPFAFWYVRDDVNAELAISGAHGFTFRIPNDFKDGEVYTFEAYILDTEGNRISTLHSFARPFWGFAYNIYFLGGIGDMYEDAEFSTWMDVDPGCQIKTPVELQAAFDNLPPKKRLIINFWRYWRLDMLCKEDGPWVDVEEFKRRVISYVDVLRENADKIALISLFDEPDKGGGGSYKDWAGFNETAIFFHAHLPWYDFPVGINLFDQKHANKLPELDWISITKGAKLRKLMKKVQLYQMVFGYPFNNDSGRSLKKRRKTTKEYVGYSLAADPELPLVLGEGECCGSMTYSGDWDERPEVQEYLRELGANLAAGILEVP